MRSSDADVVRLPRHARPVRGNAWALPPVGLDCAFRMSGQRDYFHPTIGFRLALDYPR